MIPDIGKIIVSYARPRELSNVFIQNDLPFNMTFKYDAFDHIIRSGECVFKQFPNIVLIGLAIENIKDSTFEDIIARIGLNKCTFIRKLIITQTKSTTTINILGLEQCKKLKFFRARYCNITGMRILKWCPCINHIDLQTSIYSELIPSQTLANLKFFGSSSMINIDTCSKIQHLNGFPNASRKQHDIKSLALKGAILFDARINSKVGIYMLSL